MKREPIRIKLQSDASWQHEGTIVATRDGDPMGFQEAATQAMLAKAIKEASPPGVAAAPPPAPQAQAAAEQPRPSTSPSAVRSSSSSGSTSSASASTSSSSSRSARRGRPRRRNAPAAPTKPLGDFEASYRPKSARLTPERGLTPTPTSKRYRFKFLHAVGDTDFPILQIEAALAAWAETRGPPIITFTTALPINELIEYIVSLVPQQYRV